MKHYTRSKAFQIWNMDLNPDRQSYWWDVNMWCGDDDRAFDIITEFVEYFGLSAYDELMHWIDGCNMMENFLVCLYEEAGNIATFAKLMNDFYDAYGYCYYGYLHEWDFAATCVNVDCKLGYGGILIAEE